MIEFRITNHQSSEWEETSMRKRYLGSIIDWEGGQTLEQAS